MKEIDNKKTVGHNPVASYTGDGILNVCLE